MQTSTKQWTTRLMVLFMAGAVPAVEGIVMTIRDATGVAWQDELVHKPLTFAPGELTGAAEVRVTPEGGAPIASQTSDVVRHGDGSVQSLKVWFLASVPPAGTSTYRFEPGVAGPRDGGVTVTEDGDAVELLTRAPDPVGIRLLNASESFDWPIPAADAPGPILGLRLPSGGTTGSGRFDAPFRLHAYSAEVTAHGPVFAEARIRYVFDEGHWTLRARVIQNCPMIVIEEEFDTGYSAQTWDRADRFYTFVMNDGDFAPRHGFFLSRYNPDRDEFMDLLQGRTLPVIDEAPPGAMRGADAKAYGYTLSFDEDRDEYFLNPYPTWSQRAHGFIRFLTPGGDAVGFATVRSDWWRNPLAVRFSASSQGELMVRLPIQMYEQDWPSEGFGRYSPNATGRSLHVPETTGRRSWGIMLSAAEDETENRLNSLLATAVRLAAQPLDRVKDMVLDWPDPMADAQWAEETSEAGRKALEIMRWYARFLRETGAYATYSMWTFRSLTHIRYESLAAVVDSTADLTAADRRELRALLAYQAYFLNSTDAFPWGVGSHLGNPNMSIMAVNARVKSSSPIADHPEFRRWGEWTVAFMRDYIERFTRASGATYECPSYTLGVTLTELGEANRLLMAENIGDAFETPRLARSLRFAFNWLLPPDLRFNGLRTIMPIGNTSYQSVPPDMAELYIDYFRNRDPELAGQVQWFANQTLPEARRLALVEDAVPDLGSAWIGDYGVVMRHGFGTPHETYFHMMAGNTLGHYENTDHMVYSLYAKGHPIHLHFGNGYFPMFRRPWLRNGITVDGRRHWSFERITARVETAAFTPETEYVYAALDIDELLPEAPEYPPPYPERDDLPRVPVERIPTMTWQRRVLFLKDDDPAGPNYFVLRDTFGGRPTKPTDLSLWFLADDMQREGDVFQFDGQLPVDMDVFVHTPADSEPHTDTFGHVQQPYGRLTGDDLDWYPDRQRRETQMLLRLRQPVGKGYLVVLYPRLKENDPPARFTRLADGVARIETTRSTDLVMLNGWPFDYHGDQVTFSGTAGVVRFHEDGTVVAVNHEGDAVFRVAGREIRGTGAFSVTLRDGHVATQRFEETAQVSVTD